MIDVYSSDPEILKQYSFIQECINIHLYYLLSLSYFVLGGNNKQIYKGKEKMGTQCSFMWYN